MNKLMQAYKSLDEEILRYYTKLGMKIPERTLYKTAGWASVIGYTIGAFTLSDINICLFPFGCIFAPPAGANYILCNLRLERRLDEDTDGETATINPGIELVQNITRNTRLPILAGSIALGAISYDSFNQETPNLEKAILLGVASASYFALASAMYLNDRKPKLLQRDSLLTKAYRKVKDALTPQPEPVPVPVRNYSTLESVL